jgi:hypothetical protein
VQQPFKKYAKIFVILSDDGVMQGGKRERCKFWPSCSKQNCPFIHPTTMCGFGFHLLKIFNFGVKYVCI